MKRATLLATATAGLTVTALFTAPAGAGAAGAKWKVLDDYASPSGDVFYFVRAKGDKIQIGLNSFVDFGQTKICVKKAGTKSWVCRTRDLAPAPHDLYTARIRWDGNYPTKGNATRVVRFDSSDHRLTFRP